MVLGELSPSIVASTRARYVFNSTIQIEPTDPPKSAILAAILSFLLLGGVGQIYLGQNKKGIFIIVATLVLIPCAGIGFIVPLAGTVDAYLLAEKLGRGESIGDMQWFWDG
jgi:TM2 domain-containing membrane protein YozV